MIWQVWLDFDVVAEFLDQPSAERFADWLLGTVLDTCTATTPLSLDR